MGKIKALIDTNVLLDHLAHRDGFFQDAAVIFSLVDEGKLIGIVSSLSIVNCSYVLPKHYDGNAVQYLSALPYHPDIVITRDKKGFNDLDILVMTPAEFVQKARE